MKERIYTIGRDEEGNAVSVSEITEISDGVITVQTSDGGSQVLDIDSLDGKAKVLWEYASEHFKDVASANAFIKGYNGQNVEAYSRVYKAVYDLATVGMTAEQIKREDIFNVEVLGEDAFKSAIESGVEALSLQVGMVDLTTQPKTKSQDAVMQVADRFVQRHGLNIVFVDSLGTKEGFFRGKSNQIVISMSGSKGAISRILGHETYHYIRESNKDQAKQIEDFVISTMARLKGEKWVEGRLEFYKKQGYKTREAQIDEFIADQMFDVFSNEKTVNEFVKEDASLAEKILAHIRDIIDEIKSIIKKLVATGRYEDIAAWQKDLDALENLNDMVLNALFEIEESKKASMVDEDTSESDFVEDEMFDGEEGGIKWSTKYWTPDMPPSDLRHIERVALSELYRTENYLDNVTKWLYNKKNGTSYFALYSTEDDEAPTILYASIDGLADTENDFVQKIIKMIGDAPDDRRPRTFGEILDRLESSSDLHTVRGGKSSNRRNGNGDVPLHIRASRSGVSRALLNCLQDCYERRNSVESEKKFSTSRESLSIPEEVSDYILDTKEYREILEIVDERFELAGRKELSPKAIDRLAGRLLEKSKSKYDRELLTERLTALFDYIANSRDVGWEDVTSLIQKQY